MSNPKLEKLLRALARGFAHEDKRRELNWTAPLSLLQWRKSNIENSIADQVGDWGMHDLIRSTSMPKDRS